MGLIMTVFEFMLASPWLSFFIAIIIHFTLYELFFRLPNRIIRGMNIRKHGWPPAHCDADGDFKKEENNDKQN